MLIHRHYDKLLNHPIYKQSRHVFAPENNLGLAAHYLESMVRDIQDGHITTFWEGQKKPGILKTNASTREYQFLLTNSLSQGGVKFERDLFTITREKSPDAMLNILRDQMCRFHWSIKKPNDEFSKERVSLTGKVGSLQDDLLITLAQSLYVGKMIISNPSRLDAEYGRR